MNNARKRSEPIQIPAQNNHQMESNSVGTPRQQPAFFEGREYEHLLSRKEFEKRRAQVAYNLSRIKLATSEEVKEDGLSTSLSLSR